MVTHPDVFAADVRIREHIRRTPLIRIASGSGPLWLKCEFMQHTGSFKARGAFNRVLSAKERGELDPMVGIVAASGGNAGMANAYAAARAGVPATVFVPRTAPLIKVSRLREYGADVRQVGAEYAEAFEAATEYAAQTGAVFCHAYDQLEIAAGAGTLAEEILHDEPTIDTLIVAVGGGGLLAGVLAGADGRARVVAAEPRTIPTLHAALAAGRPVDIAVSGVAADSLGARRIGDVGFVTATEMGVTSVLVDDADIAAARIRLWSEYRIAAEYGAATAYAALVSGAYEPSAGERVCVVVCGANTDPSTLNSSPADVREKILIAPNRL
ncbi:threonine/serine dehydratase [Rhodococcus sp. WS1]|uniref:threonine/serine dehydratase n=1 Tax=unclassified Rhodococcus (in: high G+C Gram-positive bacteria) TaxID=192944 RepID=UPI00114228CF|nr:MULTISPECIES: threonine/serine dehydratase [unclassified Rhodococcus (in: high G+C Gram-positive bacteria)]ROZ52881.1 threonine/serine dehydratase [Rhodococcus sp. WS1]TQC35973.1 threonine/serine dehydratase [Rhodococcus sp. WS7]